MGIFIGDIYREKNYNILSAELANKISTIENLNIYEIYINDTGSFPRPPLVLEFKYNSINIHLTPRSYTF